MTSPAPGVAEQHLRRWLVRAIGLLWFAQLAPWSVAVWSQHWGSRAAAVVVVGSYLGYCAWGVVVFGRLLRNRWPSRGLLAAVLVVMAGSVVLVGLTCRPGAVVSWQNWTPAPATGVGMLVQAVGGWRWGVGSVVLLGGTWALTALRDLPVAPGNMATLLGNLGQLAAFTAVGGVVFAKLLGAARAADAATADAIVAREAQARLRERMRQYELLHTNVLTTLTVVARGTGPVSAELRERCGREVAHLRTVVRSVVGAAPAELGTRLAEVVLAQGALGLRIHQSVDDLPVDVPPAVVEAVAHAVAEALNNVAKHSGVDEAWVVATGEEDGVRVTVTDRGHGFDVATTRCGFGLERSLGARVQEVGGIVAVRSCPGGGTSVEIGWDR